MTFGRPAMVTKASSGAVPLPVAVDEDFIPSESGPEASQPPDRPSMIAFFAKTLELYDIMNDVLLNFYKQSADDSGENMHDLYFNSVIGEGAQTIFEFDRCLARWTRSLPVHLRGDSSAASVNPIFYRQSIVLRARSVLGQNLPIIMQRLMHNLTCRFLHVRILLFRPALSKYCTVRDNATSDPLIHMNDSLPHRVALQCSIICVKSAQESIQLIYSNVPVDGTGGPLPAWWYNILCLSTSSNSPLLAESDFTRCLYFRDCPDSWPFIFGNSR
jgi:hypothetical protein